MNRRLSAPLIFLAALCLLSPALAQDNNAPKVDDKPEEIADLQFVLDVQLVELHVTVRDAKGRPVGGLRQEDFRVAEDGVGQTIEIFKHEDIPVSLGLVVDNSRSIEVRKSRLDAAALSFVAKSNSEDEVFVVHFDFDARLSRDFTGDREILEKTLAAQTPFGQTALYDGILLALDSMQKARHNKKALLLITDGIDNVSKSTLAQVLDRVKRDRAIIYIVGLLSESGGLKAEEALIQIADASGGHAYFPATPEEARTMMEKVAQDLREQYTIAYRPANGTQDGKWRSIRVELQGVAKSSSPALDVDHRHGYFAPEGETKK